MTTAIIRHLRQLDGRQMRMDTTCGHLRSLAVTCGHLRSLALGGHLRSLGGHLRSLAGTCGHLRSLALGGHLRSLAVTRVAASDCKWLIFRKSNTALPTCSMIYLHTSLHIIVLHVFVRDCVSLTSFARRRHHHIACISAMGGMAPGCVRGALCKGSTTLVRLTC